MEDRSKTKIHEDSKRTHNSVNHSKKIKSHQTILHQLDTISSAIGVAFGTKRKSTLLGHLNKAINHCQQQGLITQEAIRMVKNIINIEDIRVEDVMTPRTDIIAVQNTADLNEVKKLIIETEHSRIPVFKRNLDNIIGFIHSKDLAKFISSDQSFKADEFKINNVTRKILYVPHSMRITDLLLKMRVSRIHIAIVLDEYGGTDGLVSIEDIVEEIIGEIEDEHDLPDDNIYLRVRQIGEHTMQVGGRVDIEKITEFLPPESFEELDSDFETVGGLVFALFSKVPEIGETQEFNNFTFKVLDADARSVKLVEISKVL